MHEVEIFGTILTIFFTIMTVIFIKLFWVDAIAPFWVALIFTIAFGVTSIWVCVKVGTWWYYKIKDYLNRNK